MYHAITSTLKGLNDNIVTPRHSCWLPSTFAWTINIDFFNSFTSILQKKSWRDLTWIASNEIRGYDVCANIPTLKGLNDNRNTGCTFIANKYRMINVQYKFVPGGCARVRHTQQHEEVRKIIQIASGITFIPFRGQFPRKRHTFVLASSWRTLQIGCSF